MKLTSLISPQLSPYPLALNKPAFSRLQSVATSWYPYIVKNERLSYSNISFLRPPCVTENKHINRNIVSILVPLTILTISKSQISLTSSAWLITCSSSWHFLLSFSLFFYLSQKQMLLWWSSKGFMTGIFISLILATLAIISFKSELPESDC